MFTVVVLTYIIVIVIIIVTVIVDTGTLAAAAAAARDMNGDGAREQAPQTARKQARPTQTRPMEYGKEILPYLESK